MITNNNKIDVNNQIIKHHIDFSKSFVIQYVNFYIVVFDFLYNRYVYQTFVFKFYKTFVEIRIFKILNVLQKFSLENVTIIRKKRADCITL